MTKNKNKKGSNLSKINGFKLNQNICWCKRVESIVGSEEFVLTFQQMGLEIKAKELKTNNIIIYNENKKKEN